MKTLAIDLAALGDVEPLWRDWLEDARRRLRVNVDALEEELPNWGRLLERFAEERAPVYFRRDPDVSNALRRLESAGTQIVVFTDAPPELARVALAHLGATRRVGGLEAGSGARARTLERLGRDAVVVSTREELLAVT
jgi:phosphoglycolate phosphatase-like HAD superfamily hydrolase